MIGGTLLRWKKELDRFVRTADYRSDPRAARTHRKLEDDWQRASNDVSVLESMREMRMR